MEIFLVLTLTSLITVFIADTSQKRRARLCQRVRVEPQKQMIRK